ncbi:hypothetical protein ACGFY9_16595 [Streptomyces sp. NPDC048504]|uniref:hypothetical protein n=1 Tax=Streptomyces sp. NPDC048504 TaxID=3365559 RepID=UPI00371BA017
MHAPTSEETRVAAITTGLERFRRSLHAGERAASAYHFSEPRWETRFVARSAPKPAVTLRMADFGYSDHELHGREGDRDDLAMAGPIRLLSPEGAQALREICHELKTCAVHND